MVPVCNLSRSITTVKTTKKDKKNPVKGSEKIGSDKIRNQQLFEDKFLIKSVFSLLREVTLHFLSKLFLHTKRI